jgi:hypothetical protein
MQWEMTDAEKHKSKMESESIAIQCNMNPDTVNSEVQVNNTPHMLLLDHILF